MPNFQMYASVALTVIAIVAYLVVKRIPGPDQKKPKEKGKKVLVIELEWDE